VKLSTLFLIVALSMILAAGLSILDEKYFGPHSEVVK
jgi:hypothetical protein